MHVLEALMQQNNSSVRQIVKTIVDNASAEHATVPHFARMQDDLRQYAKTQPSMQGGNQQISWSPALQAVLVKSSIVAEDLKDTHISCEHLLLALLKYDQTTSAFLQKYGITYEAMRKKIDALRAGKKLIGDDESNRNEIVQDLSEFAIDITAQAAEGRMDPII